MFEICRVNPDPSKTKDVLYEGVRFTDNVYVLRRTATPGEHLMVYPGLDAILVLPPLLDGWGEFVWLDGEKEIVRPHVK